MKLEELRIGNYISERGRIIKVTPHHIKFIDKNIDIIAERRNDIKKKWLPITLTEELLFYLGLHKEFCDTENIDAWYLDDSDDGFYISNNSDIWDGFYVGATTYGFLRSIESVHQLQNLYFALTSKELQIK